MAANNKFTLDTLAGINFGPSPVPKPEETKPEETKPEPPKQETK